MNYETTRQARSSRKFPARFIAAPFLKKYRFQAQPGIKGDIELTIKTNPWTPADYGIPDHRRLGLKIDYIKIIEKD